MDQQSGQLIIETFKEEGIDMVVTLPEEPTSSLTEAIRKDPSFTSLTVAAEGNGIALCAGAALGGRKAKPRSYPPFSRDIRYNLTWRLRR